MLGVAAAQAARRLLCLRDCRFPCRRRESDELGEESVGLLGEGRPGQVGLVDPQRQHPDNGRPEVEGDGGGVPWRGNPSVHAALPPQPRGAGARRGLLEGQCRPCSRASPCRCRDAPCTQAACARIRARRPRAGSWCASSASSAAWSISAWQRCMVAATSAVTVWESTGKRRWGTPTPRVRPRARSDKASSSAEDPAEHLHGGGGDSISSRVAPPARARWGGEGRREARPGWCRPSPGHSSFAGLHGRPDDTFVHARTVVHIT